VELQTLEAEQQMLAVLLVLVEVHMELLLAQLVLLCKVLMLSMLQTLGVLAAVVAVVGMVEVLGQVMEMLGLVAVVVLDPLLLEVLVFQQHHLILP
jgi:hypothetical protein